MQGRRTPGPARAARAPRSPRGGRPAAAGLGLLLALWAGAAGAQARDADDLEGIRFPYQASGADVEQVLSDVTRRLGIVARLSEGVAGEVTIENGGGRLVDVLDQTAAQVRAVWWYDGTILHVDSDETLTTTFLDPQGLSVEAITREMQALGFYDPRFEIRSSSNGSILRISGPQGYVDQAVSLITTLNTARRLGLASPAPGEAQEAAADVSSLYLPRVYRGRPTS